MGKKWDKVLSALKEIWAELADTDKDGEVEVDEIVALAVKIVVGVIAILNDPLTNAEKRELARQVVNFLKYIRVEQLRELLEVKKSGGFDNMTPEQMDALIGVVIGMFVREKRKIGEG